MLSITWTVLGEFFDSSVRHRWKWVIISLHAALYSLAICAVQGTDPDRVKQGKRVISIGDALRRCQDDRYMLQYVDSRVLQLSEDEQWAIEKLSQEFRNGFEHFEPKQWVIEVSGLPGIVTHVTRVIKFLALESWNVKLNREQRNRVEAAIKILGG